MPNFDGEFDDDNDIDFHERQARRERSVPLEEIVAKAKRRAKRTTRKVNANLPTLVMVGKHLIDPNDVACISKITSKSNLYVVRLKSQPNMEYPIWVEGDALAPLLTRYNIVEE